MKVYVSEFMTSDERLKTEDLTYFNTHFSRISNELEVWSKHNLSEQIYYKLGNTQHNSIVLMDKMNPIYLKMDLDPLYEFKFNKSVTRHIQYIYTPLGK